MHGRPTHVRPWPPSVSSVDRAGTRQEHQVTRGDVLEISILGLFQDNQEAIFSRHVSGRGRISLPLLTGPLKVQGMTRDEVREAIVQVYSAQRILRNPSVAVMMLDRPNAADRRTSVTWRPKQPSVSSVDPTATRQEHRLSRGDVLEISVLGLFQDNQEAIFRRQVSERGRISLPLLDDPINVEGMTQDEVRDAIVQVYATRRILSHPSVAVMILNGESLRYVGRPLPDLGAFAPRSRRPERKEKGDSGVDRTPHTGVSTQRPPDVTAITDTVYMPHPRTIVIYKERGVVRHNINGWHSVTKESLDSELRKLGSFGVIPGIEVKFGAGVPPEVVDDLVNRINKRYGSPTVRK